MSMGLLIGLVMVAVSVFLFAIALPRRGEVAWYLRDRDVAQSLYMMVLVGLFASGAILSLSSLR